MAYEFKDDIENALIDLPAYLEDGTFDELDEVYRKAKSFDELVKFYPQKDEIPSDEFFMMMGYIIEEADDER